ncbi:probable endo-1,3(4)-beta-glucanase ARB_01444 [Malus sylvestris]|uniref:probable endo-1,3(4)-beta-glucanase ARB_01444 n=1 Tax=Malus sylvestris TaxID=3752 RepID=UPI0021AD3052|nr:probable endo-1,3(4)-beta-glucanase ARB_01444 [Malus sylvestris]
MLKKVRRKVKTLITKSFKKRKKDPYKPAPPPPSSFPSPPPPEEPQTMSPPPQQTLRPPATAGPFLFPQTQSTVLPDPSNFFSPNLLSSPLPTNSFFQNFALKNGEQSEYFHPYAVKSSSAALTICHPSRFSTSAFIYQVFIADLAISAAQKPDSPQPHKISSFNDLSITLDFPSSNLRFFLVRGSPFITCSVSNSTSLSISTSHAILSCESNGSKTKYTIKLNSNQTWLVYTSSPIDLTTSGLSLITSNGFSGIFRIAILPDSNPKFEASLDRFSSCYPVSGEAVFTKPFVLEYRWEKKGWGDLLMLAHPLHLQLLSGEDSHVTVLEDFKFKSIDGDLVGVVGDSWALKPDPVSITWHSSQGVREHSYEEIVSALVKDVGDLNSSGIATTSSYFYGKLIARAARLALIAEEVAYLDVIPAIRKFLKETIEPWLDGTFPGNGFLYDKIWGGIVTKQGATDSGADFGFGVYNDHHYHLGYFVYGISVLAKIDPAWGRKYRAKAYSLAFDYMTVGRRSHSHYPRLRCFDFYKLHSWAGGLTEFADGRNQESTSEAVNAYYSAALLGLAYGDTHLVATGSLLAALEIQAAQIWWHVKDGGNMYEEDFTRENRVVGMVWNNKRDSGLWFAPPEWKECRLGIQLLPLLPITEALFSDVGFVKDLVKWTLPALSREGVGEGWKGFVYSLEGIYDKELALGKIRNLNGYDDGNSLTNLLWWIHSRGEAGAEFGLGHNVCWSRHYH